MAPRKNSNLLSGWKFYVALLVGFAVFNHLIRVGAHTMPAPGSGMGSWFTTIPAYGVHAANGMRVSVGQAIQRTGEWCPGGSKDTCASGLNAVRMVLGLH